MNEKKLQLYVSAINSCYKRLLLPEMEHKPTLALEVLKELRRLHKEKDKLERLLNS